MTNQLTDHFKRSEFVCRCGCGFDTVDYMLLLTLEDEHVALTSKYGRVRIIITGPNRCEAHNRNEGGANKSTHKEAKAADHHADYFSDGIWVAIPPQVQYDLLDSWYPDSCGLIIYSNRVHFDTRAIRYRGDKR